MRPFRSDVLIGLGLLGLTLAVYLPQACRNGFVYDDGEYVTGNPHVQAGLTRDDVRWALTATTADNWHPLTWLSLQLDDNLYGRGRPWTGELAAGYHLTSVLIHAATAVLLFLVLRTMTGAVWRSALVAALFAVHPLHVESVAWISERKDVLCAFFGVAALGAYAWYAARPGVLPYLAAAVLFALGLSSKPMLVTLPCVLLLLDYWPLGRLRAAKQPSPLLLGRPQVALGWLVLEKLPLLGLSAAASVLTWVAQGKSQTIQSLEQFPLAVRCGNALVSYVTYLGKTFWPVGLAAFYPHPGFGLSWGRVAVAAAVLGVVTVAVAKLGRRCPYLLVGWLWYVGMLVPVIGFTQAGPQALADRYSYLPHIGLFIMIAWGSADLAVRLRVRPLVAGLALAAVAGCAVLAWVQVRYWHDNATLWEHALQMTEGNTLAHLNFAQVLVQQGQRAEEQGQWAEGQRKRAEAVGHYKAILAIDPDHWRAHYSLAALLMEQGEEKEARQEYEVASRLRPDNPAVQRAWVRALNTRGIRLAKEDRAAEARSHFLEALRLDANYAPARRNLGVLDGRGGLPQGK
jgi:tetratricopeptide (TPR) repeat protein